MRILFHAPMKAPDHPLPSGDRRMAQLLVSALTRAGHTLELVPRFRSFDGRGDGRRQRRIAAAGGRLARRLVRSYRRRTAVHCPDLWLTYHVYHKSPDWLGPAVSRALCIPYVVAEASHAPKRRGGAWRFAHLGAARAIGRADLILSLNPTNDACVAPLLKEGARVRPVPPFIDTSPFAKTSARPDARRRLAERLALAPATPVLLTVAMMRFGDKLASYRVLGAALAAIAHKPWALLVAGDGPAAADVDAALAPGGARVHRLGRLDGPDLAAAYGAADVFVWPAVGEAYGLALLEAAAAGLPVVAGRSGGVAEVVDDGRTGILVPVGDAGRFANAVAALLDAPDRRLQMARAAAERAVERHDIAVAARRLDVALTALVAGRSR